MLFVWVSLPFLLDENLNRTHSSINLAIEMDEVIMEVVGLELYYVLCWTSFDCCSWINLTMLTIDRQKRGKNKKRKLQKH